MDQSEAVVAKWLRSEGHEIVVERKCFMIAE